MTARLVRQALVPGVGEAGIQRLARAHAALGSDLAQDGSQTPLSIDIARVYAERAGFASVAVGALDIESLAPANIVSRAAPREVLAGARAAVRAIREALS
jgi:hypothetical protein